MRLPVLLIVGLIGVADAGAGQTPVSAGRDSRIRYVNYSQYDVTIVRVQRGTATRIILAEDEKIVLDGSGTGFSVDCIKPESEWCMRADVGTNQILIRPREGATHNNLELKTDKRNYSFAFHVMPDASADGTRDTGAGQAGPMFRVIFRYPQALPQMTGWLSQDNIAPAVPARPAVEEALAQARPQPRNWNYTIQVDPGSEDITPSLVFDDGRFTYFRFQANREVPTIFYISQAGEEGRVNFHIDENDESLVSVQRLGRRFVLRLGTAAVGIWNEAFDPDGVPPVDGSTVDGVVRALRTGAAQ